MSYVYNVMGYDYNELKPINYTSAATYKKGGAQPPPQLLITHYSLLITHY